MCILIASIPDLSILFTLNEVDIRIYLPEKNVFGKKSHISRISKSL